MAHYKYLIKKYNQRSNFIATRQVALTIILFVALWLLAVKAYVISFGLSIIPIIGISFLLVRLFVLMHECGHGSLFCSQLANKYCGFFLGIICAMPQYVWSKNHAYHHATNGDWSKYRGPLSTLSTYEYAALSASQRKLYQYSRHIMFTPLAGLFYLVINPRYTWAIGSIRFFTYLLFRKLHTPSIPLSIMIQQHQPHYWKTSREYWHMCANNIVLLTLWFLLSNLIGVYLFFTIYLISITLSGSIGLILFTVQHNYEHAYATSTKTWNYYQGAMEGTSYLHLPTILNWFTANIGYHHIHHLSASIPNYQLAKCHYENKALFNEVTVIRLSNVRDCFKYILWDVANHRIISIKQFEDGYMTKAICTDQ